MRKVAHPSGYARCSAGAGCSAIKKISLQPLISINLNLVSLHLKPNHVSTQIKRNGMECGEDLVVCNGKLLLEERVNLVSTFKLVSTRNRVIFYLTSNQCAREMKLSVERTWLLAMANCYLRKVLLISINFNHVRLHYESNRFPNHIKSVRT